MRKEYSRCEHEDRYRGVVELAHLLRRRRQSQHFSGMDGFTSNAPLGTSAPQK